jgi:hypothetical protein
MEQLSGIPSLVELEAIDSAIKPSSDDLMLAWSRP